MALLTLYKIERKSKGVCKSFCTMFCLVRFKKDPSNNGEVIIAQNKSNNAKENMTE